MKTLKDFLNERQLGPMVVKNPDEQKFVDKHVVQKHDDRNGNGDDVFKAANVKKADRKKDRHGYEPGEDEAVYEEKAELDEKIDMEKATMGDVIKDFQDSDAPQFKGKSDKKRRAMAIAAKLTAERGSKGYTKEERLLSRLEGISENHKTELTSIFSKLSEENQNVFLKVCESESGIEQMLDFAIQNRGK